MENFYRWNKVSDSRFNIKIRLWWPKLLKSLFQSIFHCLWKSEIILHLYLGKIFWEVRSWHMLARIPNMHTVSLWQVINRSVSLNLMGFALLKKHFLPKYSFSVTGPAAVVHWCYCFSLSYLLYSIRWKFHTLHFSKVIKHLLGAYCVLFLPHFP